MIYKNGVLADGSGLFELDADTFGIIMDAFGFFDDKPSDDDDYDDDDDDGLGPIGDRPMTVPASVDVQLIKLLLPLIMRTFQKMTWRISLNGTPVDRPIVHHLHRELHGWCRKVCRNQRVRIRSLCTTVLQFWCSL